MQGKSVEVLLLSFSQFWQSPAIFYGCLGTPHQITTWPITNCDTWYDIFYIFQHDRWRCLGQVVGHCCRRRNQVNRTFSRRVKCFCQMLFCTELLWTFPLDFHRQLDLYNFLHILFSSLGETQQFCGDYIFSGHTGCLILAYLVVSHNLHDILDLKRGNWS